MEVYAYDMLHTQKKHFCECIFVLCQMGHQDLDIWLERLDFYAKMCTCKCHDLFIYTPRHNKYARFTKWTKYVVYDSLNAGFTQVHIKFTYLKEIFFWVFVCFVSTGSSRFG